jgi:phosphatidylglycerophosphate synthase
LPFALATVRLVLAPVMLLGALFWPNATSFFACLLLGLVSDIFDGVLARRLGVATDRLRRFDSVTDVAFYGAMASRRSSATQPSETKAACR